MKWYKVVPCDINGNALGVLGSPLIVSSIPAGLVLPEYDYVFNTTGATTDTYQFFIGGAGGTLVAQVGLVFTDATKATLLSVTKT
jgi:hypothetical protein